LSIAKTSLVPALFLGAAFAVQMHSLQNAAYFLICAAVIVAAVFAAEDLRPSKTQLTISMFLFVYIAYHVRSATISTESGPRELLALLPLVGVVAFAHSAYVDRRTEFYRSLVVLSLVVCFALFGFTALNYFPEVAFSSPYAGIRWVGGFDGPNEMGQFYVIIVAILLGLYQERKVGVVFSVSAAAALFAVVFLSFSRGALLSCFILFAVFLVQGLRDKRIAIILVLSMAGVIVFIGEIVNAWFYFLEVRERAVGRWHLLDESIRLFSEKPLFGGGLGYFARDSVVSNSAPHSDYLVVLTSGGLFSVVIFVPLIFGTLFVSYRRRLYVEFFVLISFCLHAVTWNNLVRVRLSILFCIVIFFLVAALRRPSRAHVSPQ